MVPLALLAASAIFGIDGKLNADEAMRVSEQAQDEYSCAVEKFNQRKKDAEKSLQTLGETKLNIYGTQIRDFVSAFSILKETQLREGSGIKELEKLSFDDKQFEQLKLDTLEKGMGLVVTFVTLLIICQVLPLAFAMFVKFGRG